MKRESGQSLVEMAIVMPLLVFILIGLFEVGWALRTYLIMVNVTREAARTAVRPDYTDPETKQVRMEDVIDHVRPLLSNLPEHEKRAVVILTLLQVDTGYPCDPELWSQDSGWADCNCGQPYTDDNIIIIPFQQVKHPADTRFKTVFSLADIAADAAYSIEQTNCRLIKDSDIVPRDNSVMIAELVYEHHQLFGFPLISNPFTDPATFHAYTTMRYTDSFRDIKKYMPVQNDN